MLRREEETMAAVPRKAWPVLNAAGREVMVEFGCGVGHDAVAA